MAFASVPSVALVFEDELFLIPGSGEKVAVHRLAHCVEWNAE